MNRAARGVGSIFLMLAAALVGLLIAAWVFNFLAAMWQPPGQGLGFWRFLVLILLFFAIWPIPLKLLTTWSAKREKRSRDGLGGGPSG